MRLLGGSAEASALAARLAAGELQVWLFSTAAYGVGVVGAYGVMRATIRRSLAVFLARAPDELAEPQLP